MTTPSQDLHTASVPPPPDAAAADAAFEALQRYAEGSGRAELLPIDHAVAAALKDETARRSLEQRLVAALEQGGSDVALEYICSKLKLIGSATAVAALAMLLESKPLATAARDALESIPGDEATSALRERLPDLEGLPKAGVIQSLGRKRDAEGVPALAKLLQEPDRLIAGAAAAALGEIGSPDAAKALREFQPDAPDDLRAESADACLVCAERLIAIDEREEAGQLYRLMADPTQPKHVQRAAAVGLSG